MCEFHQQEELDDYKEDASNSPHIAPGMKKGILVWNEEGSWAHGP